MIAHGISLLNEVLSAQVKSVRVRTQYTHERITVYLTQDLEIPRRGHGSDLGGNWPGHAYYYTAFRCRECRYEKVALSCVWEGVSQVDGTSLREWFWTAPPRARGGAARILTTSRTARWYLQRIGFMTNILESWSRSQIFIRRSAVCAKIE